MKKINIGVLGAGHVGAQLIQNLLYQPELFVVKRVAVLNLQKHRNFNISLIEITTNILDVIEDPNIDVIVDCLPGAELPQQAMIKSLHWNKMIVSCGKEVWNRPESDEIISLANSKNIMIYLNSLICGEITEDFLLNINLTHKNIRDFDSMIIYRNRGCNASATALSIQKDLWRIIRSKSFEKEE